MPHEVYEEHIAIPFRLYVKKGQERPDAKDVRREVLSQILFDIKRDPDIGWHVRLGRVIHNGVEAQIYDRLQKDL